MYPIPTDPVLMARAGSEILYSVITVILFSTLLLIKDKKFFEKILRLLFLSAIINSFVLIFNHFFLNQTNPYGMLNNSTADACFIVSLLPLSFSYLYEKKFLLFLISGLPMIFSIGLSHSNTAIGGIGICLAFYLLQMMSFKRWVLIMIPITLLFIFFSKIIIGNRLLVDHGRYFVWEGSWRFFKEFANYWIGFGTGTFTVWGDAWQRAGHLNDPNKFTVWLWLHCEPLQILFENGILGLLSALIVFLTLIKRSFLKKSIVFPIACVYGFTCLTEMPLRIFVTQVLGICLVGITFKFVR
jgi:hypothetical protein